MAENKNERMVKGLDSEGTEHSVLVVKPNAKHQRDGQMEYNKAFRDALESGALLRQRLESYLREQKIWDDDKQKQYDDINKQLLDSEKKLAGGGIKLREAKRVAMEMRENRTEFRDLISERTSVDTNTAEGQADNSRFNYLASVCLLNPETEKPIFDNMETFEEHGSHPYVIEATSELAKMLYDLDPNYDKNLPENKFLVDYDFADEELRLVNSEGHLIDVEGRLINEDGRFIDENGDFIDIRGNRIDVDGAYVVDFSPFVDDDGNPVGGAKSTKKKATKSKTTKVKTAKVKTKTKTEEAS